MKNILKNPEHLAVMLLSAAIAAMVVMVFFAGKNEGKSIETCRQVVADDLGKGLEYQTMLQQMLATGAGGHD
jgi:hypothetical protein